MVTREGRLAQTFVDVADTLVSNFDVVDLHTLVAERCMEIFHVDAAGLLVANANRELRVMATSDDDTRAFELLELQSREGPCFECFRSGQAIVNQDLKAESELWPRFAPAATAHGYSTVHALPMRLRNEVIGALNLFQVTGYLTRDDLISAQALADIATIAILHHRATINAQVLNEQLDQALTSRIAIEQAKGMLAAKQNLSMDEAFSALRSHARQNNERLVEVAQAVIDGSLNDLNR